MSVQRSSVNTEDSGQRIENIRTIEDMSSTSSEVARVESLSFLSANLDQSKDNSFELNQGTSESMLMKKESKVEPLEFQDRHLDYPTIGDDDYTNRNGNENLGLKPKHEFVSSPLNSLDIDTKFNHASRNMISKLKIESESKLKTDLLTDVETTVYIEENTSVASDDPLTEVKEPIPVDVSLGSEKSESVYQTRLKAFASHELKSKYLNPVVVLNSLPLPVIGSIQTEEESTNFREGDDQHLQTRRNYMKRIGSGSCLANAYSETHTGVKLCSYGECSNTHSKSDSLSQENSLRKSQKCGKSFTRSSLYTHLLTHTCIKLFTCKQCGKSFGQKRYLASHLISHTPIKLFSCIQCGKSFHHKCNLESHLKAHTGIKLFNCKKCGKSFARKDHLNSHLVTHTGIKEYTCEECGKSFGLKNNLKSHLVIHTGIKEYTCEECGKSFGAKSDLRKHFVIHTGIKLLTCEECGKSFARKCNLNRHLIFHTGIKKYTCEECGKSFAAKNDLTKHLVVHTGRKEYNCEECGKLFSSKRSLKSHLINHTGKKIFTCEECGKSFGQKRYLVTHSITHTGIKLFSCMQCGKSFGQKCRLAEHSIIHTGIKLFSCMQCGKSFYYKGNLKSHTKTHRHKFV